MDRTRVSECGLNQAPAQSPDGHTTHEIYGGPSPSSLTLLGTVDGSTTSSQWLQLNTTATNVRYVKVLTTALRGWRGMRWKCTRRRSLRMWSG
ncbi:MAG TPA: hypothetical protein VGO56_22625 [Pyrinomonadaceae bacterium]|nr:hypothetical protein [Pyrinomonadaceae bacterium]